MPDFSVRRRLIKTPFAKALPTSERLSPTRAARGERGIWQRRFWEHPIRDEDDFGRCQEYCAINPVKRGLVRRAIDWPHSSFHRDVRLGIFAPDWGVDIETPGEFGERHL
jgi:putative transposase